MVRPTDSPELTELDREIGAAVRSRTPGDEQPAGNVISPTVNAPELAMPEYVEHRDGATEIGKLSAEAVVREFEAAAKEIEAMGAELFERVKQCEAMTRDAFAVTDELKQIAARYREEAKRVFVQIENCSLITSEVRKACIELKERIIVSPPGLKQKKM
jgi:hypothetical protein